MKPNQPGKLKSQRNGQIYKYSIKRLGIMRGSQRTGVLHMSS